jgi:V/A-type H+-transporting ATPase subunit I
LKQQISTYQSLHNKIVLLQDALEERIRRYSVRNVQYSGIEVENRFRYYKGYIPKDAVNTFIDKAKAHNWGYLLDDPNQEELDEIPTLIRSPKWAESIKPIMNFMGLVPGYSEIDVSQVFMLFFTFFTGILVGDAGYGLIFLLITLFVHSKQNLNPELSLLWFIFSRSPLCFGVS